MRKKRLHNTLSIIINVSIVLFTIYSISFYYTNYDNFDLLLVSRSNCFRYFTNLSNIFVAVTSLITLIFNCRNAVNDKYFLPEWVMTLKFSATVSVMLTFLTVVFFLAPITVTRGLSYFHLFEYNYFFLHFLTPFIAIISVVFFERAKNFKFRYCAFGVIPMMLYSFLYYYEVIILSPTNGGWPDFYSFTFGGNMKIVYVSGLVIYGATFGFCALLWKLQQIRSKKVLEKKNK